jgi:hypothetical protein
MKAKTKEPKPVAKDAEVEAKDLTVRVNALSKALVLEPKTPDEASSAVEQRNGLKELAKELDRTKKGITDPINAAIKKVRELFKPAETKLENAIAAVTRGLEGFHAKARAELEMKRERLEQQVEDGEITQAKAFRIEAKATERTGAGVVPTRKVRTVRVVDESLVPDRFWVIDFAFLRSVALTGEEQIPGVVVEETDQVYAR